MAPSAPSDIFLQMLNERLYRPSPPPVAPAAAPELPVPSSPFQSPGAPPAPAGAPQGAAGPNRPPTAAARTSDPLPLPPSEADFQDFDEPETTRDLAGAWLPDEDADEAWGPPAGLAESRPHESAPRPAAASVRDRSAHSRGLRSSSLRRAVEDLSPAPPKPEPVSPVPEPPEAREYREIPFDLQLTIADVDPETGALSLNLAGQSLRPDDPDYIRIEVNGRGCSAASEETSELLSSLRPGNNVVRISLRGEIGGFVRSFVAEFAIELPGGEEVPEVLEGPDAGEAVEVPAAPEAEKTFRLVVEGGRGERQVFPVTSESMTIGRSADSDVVVLDDYSVIRRHVILEERDGAYVLLRKAGRRILGNVVINGQEVEDVEIPFAPGDKVMIGQRTVLSLEAPEG